MSAAAKPSGRRRLFALAALAVALIAPANAHAYWISTGWGGGSGNAATLDAPTNVVGTPGAGTVALSWNAVTPPGSGSVTYYVTRNGGNPAGDCPTSSAPTSVLTCTDSGLAAGTFSYTVTAVWHSWATASSPPTSVTLSFGAVDHFLLAAASITPTAGTADNLTVTAKDAAGITVTLYTGSHNLTFSGAGTIGSFTPTVTDATGTATNFGNATAITFTNGVATVSGSANGAMTLYKAETASIVVSDGSGHNNGTGLSVTVAPLALNSFNVPTPATQTAGTQFSVSVTARDVYGNTATGYTGQQCLNFSGPANSPGGTAPTYPAQGSCSAGRAVTFAAGLASPNVTLFNAASTTLTVADAPSGKTGSTGAFTVNGGVLNSFTIPNPGTQTAGSQFSITLTAKDVYGNTANYSGAKSVVFSGPANSPNGTAPSYPATVTFTNGVGPALVTLFNAASTTLTATESGHSGSTGAFTVNPGALDSFTIPTPAMQTAGTPFSVSLTAKDAYGNTTTGYTGNGKCIVFSGPANSPDGHVPVYPAQGSCAAGQSSVNFTNGVSNPNPSITLYRATPSTLYPGTQTTITATDAPSSKSGSTGAFNVNGTGVRSRFLILPDTTTPVAGAADNLTIVLGDPYGNPTNYNVSPNLTFAGANNAPNGTQPTVTNSGGTARNFTQTIQIAFVNGVSHVNGTANGLMRLYRVETANITVRLSTGTPNYVSNALAFNVQPAAITTFTVTNPAAQTAGTSFNLSITATDTYGNANTGTRCLTFSGPANAPDGTPPSYPAQGSCAAGQSEVTFTAAPTLVPVTLYRAAATTLTITDVQSGFVRTTASFTVDPAAIDHFSMTAATTTPTAGATDNLSITAIDPYGNTASGYTGSHDLTFSGAGSIRTYDPTVTNSGGTATDFGTATAITFTNGVSSAGGVMRLYRAQTAHIVVSDGSHDNGSGLQVTVSPAAFDNLALSAEKAVVRPGATDQLTIRAVDLYGNTAPGYTDGAHNIYFAGGTGTRTVTNTSGSQIAFGSATSLVFANGVSTTGGVMRINDAQTANITAGDGVHTSPAYRIVVSGVSASVVSAGGFHTCALVAGGVQCWGYNNYGQLGNNSTTNSSTPVRVVGVGGTGYLSNVTQISAGKYHTCAVVSGGAVYCWGQNASGPNVYGQLGNNSTTNSSTPVQVLTDAVTYLTNVTQVGSGGGHTCALRSDNTVYCWGRNAFGEVGDNTTTRRLVAVQVRISAGAFLTNAVQIAIGANHSCAQLSDSTVRCWGYNFYGEIGDNTTTNSSVATQVLAAGGSGSLTGVSAISSGRFHTCALLSDHSVYCWGDNDNGELGDGTTTSRSLPVRAGTIDNATSISAGEYHSCSVLDDGTAQCWGAAAFGQVGDGTTADTSTPVPVVGPGGWGLLTNIAAISAGGGNWPDGTGTDNYEHTVALLTDGTVVSWGQNIYGELGDGTTTMSIFPTGVALL